jgi:hypothetical protein
MWDKIKAFFVNKYLQSFIRTAGLWLSTTLVAIGVAPELAGRFANDTRAVLEIVVPYLVVQLLSFLNAKKSK